MGRGLRVKRLTRGRLLATGSRGVRTLPAAALKVNWIFRGIGFGRGFPQNEQDLSSQRECADSNRAVDLFDVGRHPTPDTRKSKAERLHWSMGRRKVSRFYRPRSAGPSWRKTPLPRQTPAVHLSSGTRCGPDIDRRGPSFLGVSEASDGS